MKIRKLLHSGAFAGALTLVMAADAGAQTLSDVDKEQRSEDAAIRKGNADGAGLANAGAKRMAGMSMSQLSGASGMRYREVSATKKHPLFRKRQRR